MPLEENIRNEFGSYRTIDGTKVDFQHAGLDIKARAGASVKVTNSGLVTLAKNLKLTGNTVVVDHGFDIFSIYYHMEDLNVKSGDAIKKGQVVGTVGDTGQTRETHLYWIMSHDGVEVNPWLFLDEYSNALLHDD